jgi:hypothetical protein
VKPVHIPKEKIDEIFAAAKVQSDYIIGLYRAVFPSTFDDIESMDGYPKCSKRFSLYVFEKAMAWDRKHALETGKMAYGEPTFLPGGAWMNWGFSVDEELVGFHVVPCPAVFKPYKEPSTQEIYECSVPAR